MKRGITKFERTTNNPTPVEMAAGLVRAHGVDYAKRMVEKIMDEVDVRQRPNLPVGPVFYEPVGPKDWRLKTAELDKTLNFWKATQIALKPYKSMKKDKEHLHGDRV